MLKYKEGFKGITNKYAEKKHFHTKWNINLPVKKLWYLTCINISTVVGLLRALELKNHTKNMTEDQLQPCN